MSNKSVQLSDLSPEKKQQATDYANKLINEAHQKARASGAYDYDVGRIIKIVIFSIFWMFIVYVVDRWLKKYRIAYKILFLPMVLVMLLLQLFIIIFIIH
jgi:hypothetical protein